MVLPSRNDIVIPGPKETVDIVVQSHDRPFKISEDIAVNEMEGFLKALMPKCVLKLSPTSSMLLSIRRTATLLIQR